MKVGILIICVVFTSHAQCSTVLSKNVIYGLATQDLNGLNQIISYQDSTISANFAAFNPIFDLIEKYLSIIIYDLEDDNDPVEVAEAFTRVRDGIDYSLEAIKIALGDSSIPVEEARNAAYAEADNSFAAASSALTLAASGNYPENRAQMEVYRTTVRDAFRSVIESIYDVILTNLNPNDETAIDIFEQAFDGSILAVDRIAYAVFNAIIIYAAAVTAGNADVRQIFEVEGYREDALSGIRSDGEYKYSALKAYYISSKLDQPELLPGLNSNQYSLAVESYKFETVVDINFGVITSYLKRITLGLQDSGRSDFSPIDISQAKALATLIAGHEVFLDQIVVIHLDAESTIPKARETLFTLSKAAIAGLYNIIDVAQDPAITHFQLQQVIKTYNETLINSAEKFVDVYFDLIRNGKTWDRNSKNKFNTLRDEAVRQYAASVYTVFEAAETLAKAVDADEASESDFSAVEAARDRAATVLNLFALKISAAGVVQLKAGNSCTENAASNLTSGKSNDGHNPR